MNASTTRVVALAACLLGAWLSAPARAQLSLRDPREAPLEPGEAVARRLERELEQQRRLLEAIQRGEMPQPSASDAGAIPASMPRDSDPRAAPLAPRTRALPEAIFEREKVTIPAGRWDNRQALRLWRLWLDADADGRPERVRYVDPKSGRTLRLELDRNYDGILDAWIRYEAGLPVARVLDSNDDGNPDVWESYRNGTMIRREVDRDDDGVRDAKYRYRDGDLEEEAHDADNDGRVDLRIFYRDRQRLRAEEDRDRDGRMDTWRSYTVVDGVERLSRIERDRQGRGYADTFESFEPDGDSAVLVRREEDVNGDGEIDVSSHYRDGKLQRREIFDPDLFPM